MIRRLNFTEGQAYTTVIGLVLAIVLAVAGLPSVLRTRAVPVGARTQLNPRTATAVDATPTTTSSAAIPAVPGVVPRPTRAPVAVATPPPLLPPGISGSPTAAPALLTITTFAVIGPPGAPGGLAVGRNGTIYVTTDNGTAHGDPGASHVFAYEAGGGRIADWTISGQPDGHANGLTGVAVDPLTGDLAVLQPDAPRILAISTTSGTQQKLADIPDLPACLISLGASPCQQGAEDRKPFPATAAYDERGDLFVTDPAQDTVWRLRRGAALPEVWFQSPYFSLGDGPHGLALTDATVEVTVGTSLDPATPTAGGLYRVAVNADGTAGGLTLAAAFARGDEPGPLTIGSSGTAYVVLRGSGAIVAITPAGAQSWRIDPPGQGPIPLDAPSALALVPGQLLAANKGSGADPAHWAVLSVTVNEGPRQ